MGYASTVGRYLLGRTVGEGTFARVKIAKDTATQMTVAIKIINKQMVIDNNLIAQVEREISAMKLLCHPHIIQIYEVIATKTKIYLVMEYASGGRLSDKLSYLKNLSEMEARKYFQQLIDAVDYCHCRGVYHRDLKPENLLLDSKGNLKVSDFGLSALQSSGDSLHTACGSPSYVAPEVISNKMYDGAPADVWSCGIILFELLAGFLPFDDPNLSSLYKKILRQEYTFPRWFTPIQRRLICSLLDPSPSMRIKIAEVLENEWFRVDYNPPAGFDHGQKVKHEHDNKENISENEEKMSKHFINAFELIAMSNDLDLSRLFEEEVSDNKRTMLGSEHSLRETIDKIEAAAEHERLLVEKMNSSKVKLHHNRSLIKSRSCMSFSAEVFEVTPSHCVIEISKSAGDLGIYKEFCSSLSGLLAGKSQCLSKVEVPHKAAIIE